MTEKTDSDSEIINTFETIMNRFSGFLKSYVQKFNVQKEGLDPEDVVQEIRIKIWKIFQSEKKITNYASYIKKIIVSSVIDQIRRSRREKEAFYREKQNLISERRSRYTGSGILDDENIRENVRQAVDSLIESRRTVVKLHLLNMTMEEISLILNWSKNKTRNLLYRGLSDLKNRLREKGIEYETDT